MGDRRRGRHPVVGSRLRQRLPARPQRVGGRPGRRVRRSRWWRPRPIAHGPAGRSRTRWPSAIGLTASAPVPGAKDRAHRERQRLGAPAAPRHGLRLRLRAAPVRGGPVAVFKRNIFVHPLPRGRPGGPVPAIRGRQRRVRVGLPPPRGDGRPAELRRRARLGCRPRTRPR